MIGRKLACALWAAGLLFSAAKVEASSKPSSAKLAAITERGRLLAGYDTAVWQATDAVRSAYPSAKPSERYIAHKTDAGWVVDFGRLNGTGDKFLVAYEATQEKAEFLVKSFAPERKDIGWNLLAARGIATAATDIGGTERPYNIAVLPAESESLYVYFFPAQVQEGVYPLGADVRYRIASNGMKIVEKRLMHKSIIEYAPAKANMKVTTGYHTHVLSDVPEDTDVMLVLTRQPRVPEIVVAGAYIFTIATDGTITVADRPK